ncbi:hypothetical protein Bcav_0754 [Beutenbergia cavernae DSM 12333]|uniref:DoxX family protein n=1 Tax=Beutenbergia cavernae (strain ATCC BAA-8 / DSM 12333 / CCUG 43141 / JCM 11478 / NBRC 16432 / NCIMB 13614 / HKI 0122) TaxID=471853 RepID=C5BYQ7_BEUC1|nr:hypothetical protein Bcav_0754 [Beutenbergia cavernae DSM 12333]
MRTVLWWLLAAWFAVGAVATIVPGDAFLGGPSAGRLVEWGLPSWFRLVAGAGELLAAVLLVVPVRRSPLLGRGFRLLVGAGELLAAVLLVAPDRRSQFWGCSLLAAILLGAVATQVVSTDPVREWATAPIMLAITGTLAWRLRDERPRLRWPRLRIQRSAHAELGRAPVS